MEISIRNRSADVLMFQGDNRDFVSSQNAAGAPGSTLGRPFGLRAPTRGAGPSPLAHYNISRKFVARVTCKCADLSSPLIKWLFPALTPR